tara:strand:- start:75 stop:362 length:288 start_codon:yes stop_codon:yes gene_type:complete
MSKNHNIDLEDFESIYTFLLSEEEFECEKIFFNSIKKIKDRVQYFIEIRKIPLLIEEHLLVSNNNYNWLNNKYLNLIKHNTTLNLTTPKIINYFS